MKAKRRHAAETGEILLLIAPIASLPCIAHRAALSVFPLSAVWFHDGYRTDNHVGCPFQSFN